MATGQKLCLWWNVPAEIAQTWAAGLFTDHAMKVFAQPEGAALYISQIQGRFAWRDLARALRARPPAFFVFRAMAPAVKRQAQKWGAQLTHTDEFGPRYIVAGDCLQRFVSHFPA